MRVGAPGTPDSPPRLLRLTYPRGIVSSARFAPDRETIIYSAAWQGRNYETFETRIGSGESRPGLLPATGAPGQGRHRCHPPRPGRPP